jgi:hypothetical protein
MDITISGDKAVEIDFQDKPTHVTRALVRALNRGIASGRTVMVREIARDTGMKSKDVRDAMRTREATAARLEASLGAGLKRIALAKFGARQTSRGVTYNVGRGRALLAGAFFAGVRTGHEDTEHRGVFMRKLPSVRKSRGAWSKNLPMQERWGPSLGHVFAKYRRPALEQAHAAFVKNFDHELAFAKSQVTDAGAD